MEKVGIDEVDETPVDGGSVRYELTEQLGTTDVAINVYRLEPGEGLPGGLHAHMDQEEVFVVLAGEAVFETMDGEVTVRSRETIQFAPGEFQTGRAGETETRVLALGAPRDSDDIRVPARCPACGHDNLRLLIEGGVSFECPACDERHQPAECPTCGHADLEFTLDGSGDAVVACQGCGNSYDEPPLRE